MTITNIPEDSYIKSISDSVVACMKVSAAADPCSTDRIIVEIPKSQVAIMAKKGTNKFNKGGNHNSVNVMMLFPCAPNQCRDSEDYRSNPRGEVNPPYLLNSPNYGNNYGEPNPEARPSSIFLALPTSLAEHNRYVDSPNK